MSDDLMKRLRSNAPNMTAGHAAMHEAANRIEALEAERDTAIAARDADRARVRREALEEAAKVADRVHDAAIKWAKVYAKDFDGETDSSRIAAAIRAMIKEEGNG